MTGMPLATCDVTPFDAGHVRRGSGDGRSFFCSELEKYNTPATHVITTKTDIIAWLCDDCAEAAVDYSGQCRPLVNAED